MNGWWLVIALWAGASQIPQETVSTCREPCEIGDTSFLQLPQISNWTLCRAERIEEQEDRFKMRLWFEAPAGLGGAEFKHFQALELWFDKTGRTTEIVKKSFPKKADLEKLESIMPLKRFAERYGPLDIFHPAHADQPIRVLGQSRGKVVPQLVLVLEPGRMDPVESYRVLDIAGFCGRRELLRFGQFLSLYHPGCRAVDIEARRLPVNAHQPVTQNGNGSSTPQYNCKRFPLGNCLEAEFVLEGRLEGPNCPERFSVKVDQKLNTTVLP